jgi:miniconductance mechanosensitive channel
MREYLNALITQYGLSTPAASILADCVLVSGILLLSLCAYYAVRKIALRAVVKYVMNNLIEWDNVLLERKVFQRVSYLIPAIVIYYSAVLFPEHEGWVQRFAIIYCIIVALFVVEALLSSADDLYGSLEVAKTRPIKGYVQVAKIVIFIVGIILVIAKLLDQSPVILLSGFGAMTAVLLLLFKDSILGLVAGIQLATNDMVRIGDWIEMPKYGADGDVIEISLHTVKVENWDRTITAIPSYALVSDSFKNWRGMQNSGGRRIKRSIYIDKTSVFFCTEEMVERFKKIQFLTDYISRKQKEIQEYNAGHSIDTSEPVNGRQITNIGTLRAYIENYLRNHPKIHKGMTLMVRQLQPTENGLPLEIYAFTNDTNWINYEAIQADIFDHILSVIPSFGLRVFQAPSGHDMRIGLGAVSSQRIPEPSGKQS